VSNFLLALVLLLAARGVYVNASYSAFHQDLLTFLMTTALLSIGLGLFNLIPIPPLDGSKILAALLPDRLYFSLMRYERYGMLALLALVATGVLGRPLNTAISYCYDKMFFIAQFGYDLVSGGV